MTSTDVTVRLATRADVPGVMALESRYYVGNLDVTEQEDGFISVLHSADWFSGAVDTAGLHVAVTDDEALAAFHALCRYEGIIPALESSHALAYAAKLAPTLPKDKLLLVNLSGRGDKDMHTVAEKSGIQF